MVTPKDLLRNKKPIFLKKHALRGTPKNLRVSELDIHISDNQVRHYPASTMHAYSTDAR